MFPYAKREVSPCVTVPSPLFCRPERSFLSHEPFFCRPEPLFLSPRAKREVPRRLQASGGHGGGCRPEPLFLSPRAKRGVPRCLHASAGQGKAVAPSLFFCRPEHPFLSPRAPFFVAPSTLFCHPEPSGEGSLGAYTPREDMVGAFAPSPLFVAPRRQPRGPPLWTPSRTK